MLKANVLMSGSQEERDLLEAEVWEKTLQIRMELGLPMVKVGKKGRKRKNMMLKILKEKARKSQFKLASEIQARAATLRGQVTQRIQQTGRPDVERAVRVSQGAGEGTFVRASETLGW